MDNKSSLWVTRFIFVLLTISVTYSFLSSKPNILADTSRNADQVEPTKTTVNVSHTLAPRPPSITLSPTPSIPALTISEEYIAPDGWKSSKLPAINLAIDYHPTWKMTIKDRSLEEYDPVSAVQLSSPTGYVLKITTGLYGIGGGCGPIDISTVYYEPITVLQTPLVLRWVREGELSSSTTNNKYEEAVVLHSAKQCLTLSTILISEIGRAYRQRAYPQPTPKELYGGLTAISMGYRQGDSWVSKSRTDFAGTDYKIAKEILSRLRRINE